jgi:cysteine desulfurase
MKDIIYLDNAATTALDPLVLAAMLPYMSEHYGNPSANYSIGRQSRLAVESARKKVADLLGVRPTTIYFTSGGTESNNTVIASAVNELNCTHIITAATEHHAVLHTVKHYCKDSAVSYSYVNLERSGAVDLSDLEHQLSTKTAAGIKCLVTLMHANNETGTLLDIKAAGVICKRHGAVFHSDCVQTIGHYAINLFESGVNFAAASGHKFHGPKGTGILYVSEGMKFAPLIHGGGQERKRRAGTENVHGIIGFSKALSIALENVDEDRKHIQKLSKYMRKGLMCLSELITFNSTMDSLYTVLSANFPSGTNTDFMLALLDSKGICASGGSACSSEEPQSHVISALRKNIDGATIRFSFSKATTISEIEYALQAISNILETSTLTASR